MTSTRPRPANGVRTTVAVVLAIGIACAGILAMLGLRAQGSQRRVAYHGTAAMHLVGRAVPPSPVPPPLPPLDFVKLPVEAALASNAALPVSTEPIVAARPFRYDGAPEDSATALTCLAAAVLYEAGDDAAGEMAVAQVVLNRLRHPAFPKTVCGVVFQGAERPTGCQFTFTCDGALARPLQPEAWRRANEIAAAALAGKVDPAVGTATHYHTNWVVPYWRDSLVKLAQVHTQIFYRWAGRWGTRPAFTGTLQPGERIDATIDARLRGEPLPAVIASAPIGPAIEGAGAVRQDGHGSGLSVLGVPAQALRGNVVRAMDRGRTEFILQLDPVAYPGTYALASLALCGTADRCRVMGWMPETEAPSALPVRPEAMRTAAFVYTRSRADGVETARWDCRRIKRDVSAQCLPSTAGLTAAGSFSPAWRRAGEVGTSAPAGLGPRLISTK